MNPLRHRMSPARRWLIVPALIAICTLSFAQQPAEPAASQPSVQFSAQRYLDHVKYLASDELGGRGTGTPGIEKAATYIVEQFQQAGCKPAGVDGTWFQPFEVPHGQKLADEKAHREISGLDRAWKVREDWIPFPFSASKDVEGPIAFAGYGIQAAEYDYDDYDEFDAKGKILLVFRYEPKADDPKAKFGGDTPSDYAPFKRKARTASRHDVKALLIVNPPSRNPDQDELYRFDDFAAQETYLVPMVHISRALAEAILHQANMPDLKTLEEKINTTRKPMSKDLGLTLKLSQGIEPNILPAKNVLAVVPGSGDTSETIVVGAHYDHLGTTTLGEGQCAIYHGADDNASGTAGVLELARAVAGGPKLRRNVLFITFSGEELGLLGSRQFVQHPTVELSDIRAMLNLDMIGRLNLHQFMIFGLHSAAEFPDLVSKEAQAAGIEYRPGRGMSGGSDHASFARKRIPILFEFTGIHKQYHKPEDTADLIDGDGAAKVLDLSYRLLVDLANMTEGPTYTEPTAPVEEEEPIVRPAIEEQRAASQPDNGSATQPAETGGRPSKAAMKVRLGIIPDFGASNQPGLAILGSTDGSPAQAAGMVEGDRIIKIKGQDVSDMRSYMRIMQGVNPGDEIEITIVRKGETKTLKAKFPAAQEGPKK